MKRMGIEAIYRRPNASKPAPGHKIYPYRLRGVTVERPNQVWATDMTYIPMARGFVYLVAVVDWSPARAFASGVEHDGSRLLRRRAEGRDGRPWQARDLQQRPGQPCLDGAPRSRALRSDWKVSGAVMSSACWRGI